MKAVCWAVLWLLIGFVAGVAMKFTSPTVHECISVCMEYFDYYNETIDYD